jgi:hypothetical protein
MTTTLTPTNTGPRVTLATYTTETGEERTLIGQRIDGIPRVTDEPADEAQGETYIVEPQIEESKSELDGIIADYIERARELGRPPLQPFPGDALDRLADAMHRKRSR